MSDRYIIKVLTDPCVIYFSDLVRLYNFNPDSGSFGNDTLIHQICTLNKQHLITTVFHLWSQILMLVFTLNYSCENVAVWFITKTTWLGHLLDFTFSFAVLDKLPRNGNKLPMSDYSL